MRGTGYTVKDGWDDAPVRGISLNAQAQEVQEAQGLKPVQADRQHVDNTHGVDIDWGFIGPLEGERLQDGYVPELGRSQSGVTVATGVDLGQRNSRDLERLGLSDSLRAKLEPYLGLKQHEAQAALDANPLHLSEAEVDELDQAVRGHQVDLVVNEYNSEVTALNAADGGNRPTFQELPREMQTVIASVSFQYGDLSEKAPNFFEQVTHQRWDDALANLRNFGDDYSTRRNTEADLLTRGIAGLEP